MDPLQQYAQQAGLLGGTVPGLGGVPNSALAGITDEDLMGNFVPGYVPEEEVQLTPDDVGTPYTLPSQIPDGGPANVPVEPEPQSPAPVPSEAPSIAGLSQSRSVSERGYSPAKAQQIARGPEEAGLAADFAAIDQRNTADAAAYTAAAGAITQRLRSAEDARLEAQNLFDVEKARQDSWYVGERNKAADELKNTQMMLDARETAAMADYMTSVNEWRNSRVDPGQLWGRLSGGERVGMMGVAFVDAFLGAKGIKSNALQTWEKAVDRNIHSQLENIRLKQDASSVFKQLYEMQRAKSTSDMEAALRMKGYYLETAKLQMEQHLAQFKAPLAAAQSEKAKAEFDQAFLETAIKIKQQRDTVANAERNQAIDVYEARLRSADASRSLAETRAARLAKERADAAEKAKAGLPDDTYVVYDDSETGQGYAKWELKVGTAVDPKTGKLTDAAEKFLEKQAKMGELNRKIDAYMTTLRKYGNKGPLDRTRLKKDDQAKLDAQREDIFSDYIFLKTGAAASKQQIESGMNVIPDNSWFTVADVAGVMAGYKQTVLETVRKSSAHLLRDLPEGDSRRNLRSPRQVYDEPGLIDAKNTFGQLGDPKQDTILDTAQRNLTAVDADSPLDSKTQDRLSDEGILPATEWRKYTKENPGVVKQRATQGATNPIEAARAEVLNTPAASQPPKWSAGIITLRKLAEGGDQDARAQLEAFAGTGSPENREAIFLPDGSETKGATDVNSPLGQQIRAFALYELAQMAGVAP